MERWKCGSVVAGGEVLAGLTRRVGDLGRLFAAPDPGAELAGGAVMTVGRVDVGE